MRTLTFRLVAILIIGCLLSAIIAAQQQQRWYFQVEPGHRDSTWVIVAFSPDGKYVLSGGSSVILWDARTGRAIMTMAAQGYIASSVDGKLVVGERLYRSFNDYIAGRSTRLLGYNDGSVGWLVAFSPDGRYVIAGCSDSTMRLWDTEAPAGGAGAEPIREFGGHAEATFSIAVSADLKYVISISGDHNAIRLWDFATGKEIRKFGYTDTMSVTFSPDAKYVLFGKADHTLKLRDISTGRNIRTFRGHTGPVQSVAFSPDGKYILSGSYDETMRLWDSATGREVRRFQVCNPVWSVAISSDGRYGLSGGSDGTPRLWDLATGEKLRSFRELFNEVYSVAVSPGGDRVLLGSRDGILRLWDLVGDRGIGTLKGHSARVGSVAFSSDGKSALSGKCGDGTLRLWDIESRREIRCISPAWCGALSPNGKYVLSSYERAMRLLDLESGQEIRTFRGHTDNVLSIDFSHDGKYALTGCCDNIARLWDVASGRLLRRLCGHTRMITHASFSPDGKRALSLDYDGLMILWDFASGKEIRRYQGDPGPLFTPPDDFVFSPDGTHVLCGERTLVLREITTGNAVRYFGDHAYSGTDYIAFFPDGKRALSANRGDCATSIWDLGGKAEICSLISVGEDGWAVVTPDGRFDGSSDAMRHLSLSFEDSHVAPSFHLEQLKSRFFEPGLLSKLMGNSREALRLLPALESVKLFPDVQVGRVDTTNGKVTLTLKNCGGGIGRVQVFVNGKELIADARPPNLDINAEGASITVSLAGAPLISAKENTIRVVTWNNDGYLSSKGIDIPFAAPGKGTTEPPHLWAVVGGVSEFADGNLRLRFAAKDAESFAKALETGATRLFGAERVHLMRPADAGGAPTKESFRGAFEAVRKAKPTDVLVVYLSGRGVSCEQGRDLWCYLTSEARTADPSLLSRDAAVLSSSAITSDELAEWLKAIPALRQAVILDTCASGTPPVNLSEKRLVPGDQIRAIEKLGNRTGAFVLMGSAADSVSYEAAPCNQGLLTYSLLRGMKEGAPGRGKSVDVEQLFRYCADQVPRLAKHIGGVQCPYLVLPESGSFDMGALEVIDRSGRSSRAGRFFP